jgi:lipopolysaccharide export system protein LptA
MGGLALVGAMVLVGGAAARPPQDDITAVDKDIAELAKLRDLVQAQQARAREALKRIRQQQAALAAAAEQLEKAIREANAASGQAGKPDSAPPNVKVAAKKPDAGAAKGSIVIHMAAQGWCIKSGSLHIDTDGNVVLQPFTASLKAGKAEQGFHAAEAVLRLDQPVKGVADMGERTVLSAVLTGNAKARKTQGYLLEADKLEVTFTGASRVTAQGKVHYQSGDLPAGPLCIRGERLLLGDTLWFAGKVSVQTAEVQATGDRGRYEPAENRLYLESDSTAKLTHKGQTAEGKRIVLDLKDGRLSTDGRTPIKE